MLRILSWSSQLGGDKVHTPEFNMFVPSQNSASVAGLPLPSAVKRKRSPSLDAQTSGIFVDSQLDKMVDSGAEQTLQADTVEDKVFQTIEKGSSNRANFPTSSEQSKLCAMNPPATASSASARSTESQLKNMRQTINSQLSLEILVKHKELRLIDQEIAKCQVALEQLRRCSEIPYPSTQRPSLLVSEGKGSAVRKLGDQYPAASPAPWGVTDGPYSKHYAKWLLPDRRFDGGEPEPAFVQTPASTSASGRSTRGHYVDVTSIKSLKSRSHRGSNLQSLPAGYGQPKEKATGPMILKRKSDGAMVKLVCPDCGRHDFGSAQGFINHCRIGHSRSFASHDAAAEACGELVEYNDNGTIKGAEPVATPSAVNVHPLVRSAKLLASSPASTAVAGGYIPALDKKEHSSQGHAVSADFYASTQTPHLSALVQGKGIGLNLNDLVMDAKTKAVLPESDVDDDDMDIDSPVPIVGGRHPQVAGSKQPVRSGMSKAPAQQSTAEAPVVNATEASRSAQSQDSERSHSARHDSFIGPLPSPTSYSTTAPSLVDDDEDFDPQSPASSHGGDDHDVEFEVHDDEQRDRVARLGGELSVSPTTCAPTSAAHATGIQSSVVRRPPTGHDEDKRVPFLASGPVSDGSDRKRRKLDDN